MLFETAGFFQEGGVLMYPLLFCSFIALTFVIERGIFWARFSLSRNREGVGEVLNLLRRNDREAALARSRDAADYLLKVVNVGLRSDSATLRGNMEMAYAEEEKRSTRFMMVLDTIVTLAPLLGILGTVLGIIESFEVLGTEAGRADPLAVTGGIAKALITTAAGLIIAILTLIPYNFFRSRVERCLTEIEEVATFIEVALHGAERSGDDSP